MSVPQVRAEVSRPFLSHRPISNRGDFRSSDQTLTGARRAKGLVPRLRSISSPIHVGYLFGVNILLSPLARRDKMKEDEARCSLCGNSKLEV